MWSDIVRARTKALIEGKVFCGGYVFSAVANAATVQAHVKGGANPALLDIIVVSSAKALVQPYKGSTYTAAGTAIPMENRNLGSANEATTLAYQTPTVNVLGTEMAPTLVEGSTGGSGTGGVRLGAESADDFGFMVQNGEDLLFNMTNNSGAAEDLAILIFASELP